MKCPNCSFVNTDDLKVCKVCGFDLTSIEAQPSEDIPNKIEMPIISEPKPSKRRILDDSEDMALDSAFRSIFGLDNDIEDPPLEVTPVENIIIPEAIIDEGGSGPILSKKRVILLGVLIGLALLLLALTFFWSGLPWKYAPHTETTEATEATMTEVIKPTEAIFTLGDDAALTPVNDFFILLPEFINRGNLSILTHFENSQDALEVLTNFASIGNLEKITDANIDASEVTANNASYTVKTHTNRLINGQQTQTVSIWDFRTVLKDDFWVIESLAVDTGNSIAMDTTEVTTEKATESTTEKTTEKQTEPTKEPVTESPPGALIKGFKSSGSFSGGVNAPGQDVAFVRFGNHDTYERIAFDFYEWVGGRPTQTVDAITNYTASLTDGGRTINLIFNGAVEAYASQSNLDLSNSALIESVSYIYLGNKEAVGITIQLKQSVQFKIFNLISPAKLVVDIAPFK